MIPGIRDEMPWPRDEKGGTLGSLPVQGWWDKSPNWLFFPIAPSLVSGLQSWESAQERWWLIPWAECVMNAAECAVHMKPCDNSVLWYTHI